MKKMLIALSVMFFTASASAQEPAAVPEPPDLPPQVQSGEVLEPEVTIIESEKGTIQQYSVNGRVYMVKIIPTSGPPYYLLDSNGDGELDVREDHPSKVSVPQWVLFSW